MSKPDLLVKFRLDLSRNSLMRDYQPAMFNEKCDEHYETDDDRKRCQETSSQYYNDHKFTTIFDAD